MGHKVRPSLGFKFAFPCRSRQTVRLMRTTRLRSGLSFGLARVANVRREANAVGFVIKLVRT
jgi:hypothetical protein